MINHIFKKTEKDDITAKMTIRNGKVKPEIKKKTGISMRRTHFIIRKGIIIYLLTSQFFNIYKNIYIKTRFKDNKGTAKRSIPSQNEILQGRMHV